MDMNSNDFEFLNLLKKGESIKVIGQKLGIPKSTAYYQFNKLKKSGYIQGLKVNIDYEKNGDGKTALIMVEMNEPTDGNLSSTIKKISENRIVSSAFVLKGEWNLMFTVNGTDENIDRLVKSDISDDKVIKRTQTLFITKHIEF